MASTTSAVGGMSSRMANYYDKLALEYLFPQLKLYQFADKRPLPSRSGVHVIFGRYTVPAAGTALGEGVAPSTQALSSNVVSADLRQYGYVYGVTDVLELTAIDSQIEHAVKILADWAALTIETNLRNEIIDGTGIVVERVSGTWSNANTRTALSAVYSADTMTASVVNQARARLSRLNVKPFADGNYVWITEPHAAAQLRSDTGAGGWIDVYKYAQPENIYTGEIGRLFGFRFIECGTYGTAHDGSVYIGTTQSTSATSVCAVYNLAFGQGFFGVTDVAGGGLQTYTKTTNEYDKSDPLNQYSTVGVKWTGAMKLLNPSAGVVVPTAFPYD